MACGVTLKFLGYVPGIKLPYYYVFKYLPLISVPGRFDLFIIFSFAMIIAYVIAHLSKVLNPKWINIVFTIIFMGIFVEYQQVPYPVTKIEVPAIYYEIRDEPGDFAVYDLSQKRLGVSMYFQTIHHKRIFDAFISRPEKKVYFYLNNEPIISDIYKLAQGKFVSLGDNWTDLAITKLIDLDVKYVITSKIFTEQRLPNLKPYFEDETLIVYKIY